MSLKGLLRLTEEYLRKHPAPVSAEILSGMIKLSYSYSAPATNSKSKKQFMYPLEDVKAFNFIDSRTPSLNYDQKSNRLEYANQFDSISTEEAHDKVLQDHIFGSAKINKNKDKWIYAAKKKTPKPKSYFLAGSGKSVYTPDLGELYDEVSSVGIFIWDLKLKKIVPIDIKVEGEDSNYVYSYPIFANDQGTKFICHGYQQTQFGYGISYCFNRPVDVFQVTVENLGQESIKVTSKKLVKKHQTNIFANISPCYNYVLYFAGQDYIHSYYLDLVILKRSTEQRQNQDHGYDRQWKEIHRLKQIFVGSYLTIKSQIFVHEGKPYAYFQTDQKAQQRIKCINLQTGELQDISQNKLGESYGITNFDREQKIVTGVCNGHNYNNFFYFKAGENKIVHIPPIAKEQFKLQEFTTPIQSFYLESEVVDEQFKKQKKPLLVLVHGGPHGAATPMLNLMKYLLLKCGYAILMPNFSGSSGFGQEFMKKSVGSIGKTDAKQIIQSIEHTFSAKPHLDRQRVYVYGGSYGGYMAAIMGSRYYKHFKAAVILNGVLSVPGNFWFSDIPEWSTAETLGSAKIHGLTAEDYVKMFQQSPISQPMRIPTLQFLGAKDRRVPYRQGLLFDAMTKKAGIPIQTFVYENAAHSLADSVETSIDVVLKSVQFLEGIPLKQDKNQKAPEKKEQHKDKAGSNQQRAEQTKASEKIEK